METVTDFIFLGSKITLNGDCSHKIKKTKQKHLFLERKGMTNLNSILKSRDITLPTKVNIVKIMVFPLITHEFESWIVKKAECFLFFLMLLNYGVGEDLESPLDSKEIKSVNPKGNQP